MKISNDKKYLACGTSAGVKLFDLSHDADMANKSNFAYPANVTSIGFKKSGNWLYAGSEDGTIRVHDLRLSGSQMMHKNDAEINSVALSPSEGELLAGDQNGKMMIYDLVAGKIRATMVSIYTD